MNIQSVANVSDVERGLEVARDELKVLLGTANGDQKAIYRQVKNELKINSCAFVSGAAGTGKSYLLRMIERYYRLKGYKIKYTMPYFVLK